MGILPKTSLLDGRRGYWGLRCQETGSDPIPDIFHDLSLNWHPLSDVHGQATWDELESKQINQRPYWKWRVRSSRSADDDLRAFWREA